MSEMLEIPIPSAMSRISSTSAVSRSSETGRPRITAPGDAERRSLHPSDPPSRKSTNDREPAFIESSENLDMDSFRTSGEVSRRYLCFSPFGGATSSCNPIPSGILRP